MWKEEENEVTREQQLAEQQEAERIEQAYAYAEEHKDDGSTVSEDAEYLIQCMGLPF